MTEAALGDLDGAEVARVRAALASLEHAQAMSVVLAVESGSRAWGFPSPDSDYDCRFLFVRRRERYLSLWPVRDVIELPADGVLDVNGWDVAKAIRLMCKGNAVVLEWLASPLVYRAETGLRERLTQLAERVVDRDQVARHYLHLGEEQLRRHMSNDEATPQKKIFYVLRPAVALRWMRHRSHALPPMHLPTLVGDCQMPSDVARFTSELIIRKATTRELGTAPLPAFVRAFVQAEFSLARDVFGRERRSATPAVRAEADAFFQAMLDEYG